jgi:plasmid stabilization system protein ParE
MAVIWLPHAELDLDNIYFYYESKSPQAAAKLVADIVRATMRLPDFPQMAAREPLLADQPEEFRALLVRKRYKVIYHIEDETIFISTVWDCRRNPDALIHEIYPIS